MNKTQDLTTAADEAFAAYKTSEREAERAARRLAKAEEAERRGRPRTFHSDRLGAVTIPKDDQ